jgi:hypothetical protein
MKRVNEVVMTAEEHETIANIVGSQQANASKYANKLLKEDVSKEEITEFLIELSYQLSRAEMMLMDV